LEYVKRDEIDRYKEKTEKETMIAH
jgi:hypothetical protein